ncbi:MAG: 16S rRNA (guanine(966)-N(2))-methyltransferase RsmD [Mariprofundaceae bacterium]
MPNPPSSKVKLRITAGKLRGRKITVSEHDGLRPTSARAREALFNMLGNVSGWTMLDLFAGSGLMGLEALSRGAASLTSIERDFHACQAMREVGEVWDIHAQWQIIHGDVSSELTALKMKYFDLIFADPPYKQGYPERMIAWLDQAGIRCHHLCIEEGTGVTPDWPSDWRVCKSRQYGNSCLHILERG